MIGYQVQVFVLGVKGDARPALANHADVIITVSDCGDVADVDLITG